MRHQWSIFSNEYDTHKTTLQQTSAAASSNSQCDNSIDRERMFNITMCCRGRQEAFPYGPSSLPSGCLGHTLWTSQRRQCTVLCRRLGSRSGHSSDVPSLCNDVMFWNDRSSSARTGVSVMDEWFLWTEFCLRVFFFFLFFIFRWVDSVVHHGPWQI